MNGIKTVLRSLELSLNEDKTRVIDAKKHRFDFLGFTLEVKKNPKTLELRYKDQR
ncbi:MAG: hypothetical protein Q8P64_12735 [Deltaproteobacteria bacterium]|nr:hypothetical protein [Deltaproteobacteria bacterium]